MIKNLIPLLMLAASPFAAAQKAPRGAFGPDQMDEAKAAAAAAGKPLAVIITDTESTCPKCQAGNVEAFANLRRDYILVVEDGSKGIKLAADVAGKTHPVYTTKGNIIPIVAVLAADDLRLLGGLCYKQISEDSRKAFKTLDEEVLASLAEGGKEAPAPAPATGSAPEEQEACDDEGMANWTNKDGKAIRAEAIGVSNGKVSFRMENGKLVDYRVDQLSEVSRKALAKEFPKAGIFEDY